MDNANQENAPVAGGKAVAAVYKLHKTIESTNEKIARVEAEIRKTHLAERFAFIGTLTVYFVFIWSLYINDLWGFATWLEANRHEVFAIPVFAVLGISLPLAMAFIKSIAYHHLALYDLTKAATYAIVAFLMFAGVVYEMISSSGQQQHIANTSAESSKTFQAVMGTGAATIDNSGMAAQLAKAEAKLSQCRARLADGKEKHCDGSQATVDSLKASLQSASAATAQASVAAIAAKAKAASSMKEESFKPVYKFARDVFKVTISTGVVMVAIMVSIIFEISHGLLVLILMQKERYLEFLKNSLIERQADYMEGTGKVHASEDFTDSSILDMDKLRETGEVRRPVGFTADFGRTATAHYSPLPNLQHNRHTMAAFEQSQKVPFGFAPSASRSQQSASKPMPQPMGRAIYSGLPLAELLALKQAAKDKKFGEMAICPACGTHFQKTNCGQVFCVKEHKNLFDSLVRQAS